MAISINNPLTRGLSGMLGNVIVFRNLRGRTILANCPRKPRWQSALQEENRHRFREATLFAKAAMKDPQQKEYYWSRARKLKLPNGYTAAITDYMRRPVVSRIAATKPLADRLSSSMPARSITAGEAGWLSFTARKKDFRLASAEVAFRNSRENVLVRHEAVRGSHEEDRWVVPLANRALAGRSAIMIILKDQAGNDYCMSYDPQKINYRQNPFTKGASA